MGTSELFLIALTIILAVPYAVWRLARSDTHAPLVVVQIIGGILLGPGVLGGVFPTAFATVFNPQVIGALNGIAWWSVMLFVFAAGLELDLRDAWAKRGETFTAAAAALLVPLVFGAGAAAVLLCWPGWVGPKGSYGQAVTGIGMACAVTALPILVLLMEKLGIFRRPLGDRLLRYASFDDVAIWGVLALILLDWQRIGRQGLFLVGFGLAAWGMRRLIRRLAEPDRWAVGVVWLAAAGFAADWSGLHFMVGAFLAGAVLDGHDFSIERRDAAREFLLLALMPVFFLSTGLRTQWGAGLHGMGAVMVFGAAGLLLVASVAGKLIGAHLAGWLLGWAPGEASVIGWLLQTKALIMIIFVNVLLDRQIITAETFTALLLMAVASTALTVPMARPRLARLGQPAAPHPPRIGEDRKRSGSSQRFFGNRILSDIACTPIRQRRIFARDRFGSAAPIWHSDRRDRRPTAPTPPRSRPGPRRTGARVRISRVSRGAGQSADARAGGALDAGGDADRRGQIADVSIACRHAAGHVRGGITADRADARPVARGHCQRHPCRHAD